MGAVVAFLIGSFAIWGIGDIFRGFGMATAAKIGSTELTTDQFRQIYNDRLQQIGQQIGRPITMDQARALGFDRQILAQVTAEIALDQRAQALRLGLSDAEIAKRITSDPGFQTPAGQFDAARFAATIRQSGFTEQRFVAEQRQNALRAQLTGTITAGPIVPNAAVDLANRYQNEQRSIDYVLLDHAQAGDVPPPTPEALAQYFNERKIVYRAPELRKAVILALVPSQQAATIEVSDEDAKMAYDEHPERYGAPERRHIQQILFPNATDAAAAADAIAKGGSFADIAKERGLEVLDLGTLSMVAMIDQSIADAAFALKEGGTSAPVQGRFGTVLVNVIKIEPAQYASFEEAAPEVKKAIALDRAKTGILSVYDKIEDERSEGHTLAEAAADLKLAARTIEVDRSGHDPAGAPVNDLPDPQRLITAVFSTEVGVDTDPLKVQDGYVWYSVDGVTPAHERPLDEVKDKVEADWRQNEIATRLNTKAGQLVDQVKGGMSLADVAAAGGLKVDTATDLKRGAAAAPLSESTVDTVFRTPKDTAATADAEQPGDQIVFRVTDVTVPAIDLKSDEAKSLTDTLNRSLSEDIFGQYVSDVENQIGVTLNQSAINQVVTGSSEVPDDPDTTPY
jgi:peptidyl-prolyl cis-trans isomerase D